MTDEEWAEIAVAARRDGLPRVTWARMLLLWAARNGVRLGVDDPRKDNGVDTIDDIVPIDDDAAERAAG